MLKVLKYLGDLFLIVVLTLITQIGGLLYLFSRVLFRNTKSYKAIKTTVLFLSLYVFSTFLIIPFLAPQFGRERVLESDHVKNVSWFYILCNRNYVTPQLNQIVLESSEELAKKYPGIKINLLDANFPFWHGFPLFPHLSHNDGKKLDLSFIYSKDNRFVNKVPTLSGYGFFVKPKSHEHDQPMACKEQGYFQYDYARFLTFGTVNNGLQLNETATRDLINSLTKNAQVTKIFIEPHLVKRLDLKNSKIRYHGCHAVRHDDHIHIQIR
ncbi:hypothetical protein JCM19294_2938 [Nonlabens tegetincola]|uniref:Uncharacterized protein n=1 Tax=Nonlabens tegetincola TaxID=323273 RepID=A0A090QKV7_9FLAO|nr:hypothetical protein JCM19294_2938 [Nonlabens tegetincola]